MENNRSKNGQKRNLNFKIINLTAWNYQIYKNIEKFKLN